MYYSTQFKKNMYPMLIRTCVKVPVNEPWTICGETNLTSDSGVLTSPLYPKNYPANVRCKWYITVTEASTIIFR